MMPDNTGLLAELNRLVPFNQTLGITADALGVGFAEASVKFRKPFANHFGTAHASLMFALAEAASGFAIAGSFHSQSIKLRAYATAAEVNYLRPARSDLRAHASLALPEQLERERFLLNGGQFDLNVKVLVSDKAGNVVANATYQWKVSGKSKDHNLVASGLL